MSTEIYFEPVHLSMFGLSWLTFFIAAVVSFSLQIRQHIGKMSLKSFVLFCFPKEIWKHKSSWLDLLMYLISKLLIRPYALWYFAIIIGVSHLVASLLYSSFPNGEPAEIDVFAIFGWSILLFMISDFANYLTHALQHFVPALWELHKVHHSAEHLNFATTKRMHPFGDMFDSMVAAILAGIPVGWIVFHYHLDFLKVLILIANANTIGTIAVLDILRHSHVKVSFGYLDRVLLSPHMHQLHHSNLRHHWDKNFGNKLSIWDWIFNTGYKPCKNEHIVFGLVDFEEKEYHSVKGAYVRPLIKIAQLARTNYFNRNWDCRPGFFWRRNAGEMQSALRSKDPADRNSGITIGGAVSEETLAS